MKVAHVFATMQRGGAELRTLELLHQLDGLVEQRVLCLVSADGGLARAFEEVDAPVTLMKAKDPRILLSSRMLVRGMDVVHAHVNLIGGAVVALAWLAGVPVRVVHFRSDGSGLAGGWKARLSDRFFRLLISWFATDIVGVSPGSLTFGWDDRWRSDPRCRVVVPGLDSSRFEGISPADLGSGPVIVHVGREVTVKNRPQAVRVMAEVVKKHPGVRLLFVGRDDAVLSEECRAEVARCGLGESVEWLGERSDVASILARADVLLLTSLHEGLPGVALEARASGVPVVATRLPGTEYISERLEGVRLHELAEEPSRWADSVGAFLGRALGEAERLNDLEQFRRSEFDMRNAAKGFLNLWKGESRES